MAFIEVCNIQHHFFSDHSHTTALKDISFSINEGEFISFIGPSGCGKSTLLSIIAGLIEPTSGIITHESPSIEIGYMLQQDYLFPWKTIEENISLGLTILNKEEGQIVEELLKQFHLAHTANLYPQQLSGGMRQRIALARTLAVDPTLLLLDEPFSALDFHSKLDLENFVSETLKQFSKTAILVTHDIGEAIAMSDKVYLFSNRPGTILKSFTIPDEIRNLVPFDARNAPEFQPLFQTIWKELEANGYGNVT
ncbi:spermidine/putrescine ABC transporter ATP-binding protein [Solibacillus sp. R5-41]|uniref:ABC transporter ATP-binding protein n=1 Tax=Solibacillus sp. R5-41 TaxID=2048654 RepID=UPI000C125D91|nr:ABC transporter ATP-binding protein [Solibacillus sp. R5-41]ATP38733.1 spermidine/putrescine ABC transporter ATP-binding protein [Solibacillus sp. R5-41]